MNRIEIEGILKSCMSKHSHSFDAPSKNDWAVFVKSYGTDFGESFTKFMELMSIYKFPGEIFNIATGNVRNCASIYDVYDSECDSSTWNDSMVPFYGIGNGDFFCLHKKEGLTSAVYYFDHASEDFEKEYDNFDGWIKDLINFLA